MIVGILHYKQAKLRKYMQHSVYNIYVPNNFLQNVGQLNGHLTYFLMQMQVKCIYLTLPNIYTNTFTIHVAKQFDRS